MESLEDVLKGLREAKKNPRQKTFDDVSCEDALKMVKEKEKQIKAQGEKIKIKETKLGYDEFVGKGQEIWDVVLDQGRWKNKKVSVQTEKGGTVKDVENILKKSFGGNVHNIRAKKTGKIRESLNEISRSRPGFQTLRATQATERNMDSLNKLLKGINKDDFLGLMDTLGENEKLERELNVAILDVIGAFKKAGIR